MNLIVQDTPIWYDPGRGPKIAFNLSYNNYGSNTGIFGPGWYCLYDMRVFFLPPGAEGGPVSLQIHRDNGRIETYEWHWQDEENQIGFYVPRSGNADLGYRDTVEKDGDIVTLNLLGGGKYVFNADGRIAEIWDNIGNHVTCGYTSGRLSSITDANGNVTEITSTGSGLDERVQTITLPDDRHADFGCTPAEMLNRPRIHTEGGIVQLTKDVPVSGRKEIEGRGLRIREVDSIGGLASGLIVGEERIIGAAQAGAKASLGL